MNKKKICILFSLFGAVIIMGVSILIADVIVAPVPWVPEDGRKATGNLTEGIKFANLEANSEIFVYTITGNLVRKIIFNNSSTITGSWDAKNKDGEYVSSGVYLWIVKTPAKTQTGKLIVVR